MIYKLLIKPIFFLFDPESAHNFTLKFLSVSSFLFPIFRIIFSSPNKKANLILQNKKFFKNHIGLAAGFDKNGIAIRFWEAIGFSHAEIGTVTPEPQTGNKKPRIFRLKRDEALINRLGFNNHGAIVVRKNILKAKERTGKDFIIGVNIGKNSYTPNEKAFEDYKKCFEVLFDCADYFTVNISSPNTVGLRDLQSEEYLEELLKELNDLNKILSEKSNTPLKDIFLKISPDISKEQAGSIFHLVCKYNFRGIIATNTTLSRNNIIDSIKEPGGLSGKPLKNLSTEILSEFDHLKKKFNSSIILIGVGGIFSREDVTDKMNCGAGLVQIYTGMIYEGPGLIKKLLK